MKTKIMRIALIIGLNSSCIKAAELDSLDVQVRIPLHVVWEPNEKARKIGFAFWNIFGDVAAPSDKMATLSIMGPRFEYGHKGSWVEFLGGARRTENGYVDPIIDVRFSDKSIEKFSISGEIGYFPRELSRRLYGFLAIDTPLTIGKYKMSYGVESENIISFAGKKDSLGIGPRLVLPMPMRLLPKGLSSSITVAFQHRTDKDFIRLYCGMTYKF